MRALITTGILVMLLAASGEKNPETVQVGIEVVLWAGPGAEADPRVVQVYEDEACSGRKAIARLTSMPPLSKSAALQPELVVEFSASGDSIRRWSMPVDSIVAAVAGDRIIVPRGVAQIGAEALSISTSGDLEVTTVPQGAGHGVPEACPDSLEFTGSDYLRCFAFRDVVSGEVRRIGYEGPCT